MGSDLLTIRTLLENQLDTGTTGAGTDPTQSLLNIYINSAIRRISREMKPRELKSVSPFTADITSGQKSVALPATVFVPDLVYVANENGEFFELKPKKLKQMVEIEGAKGFFDSANTGVPSYWELRGTSLLFNKYFGYSYTAGINIFGVAPPTSLSGDSDTTEIPEDYDLLIVYFAAVLFYQKDDDVSNQEKFMGLADREKNSLVTSLDFDEEETIRLDPHVFGGAGITVSNPSFLFGV